MESMPLTPRPRRPLWAGLSLLSLTLVSCGTYTGLEDALPPPSASGPTPAVPAMLAAAPQAPGQPEAANKFETPDQYGQFPSTQQATGPYKVLARNPYLNEVNAEITEVPLVANEAGSAVYPPEEGYASHYSYDFAKKLASGQAYCDTSLTAAHKKLPFGTIVRCTRRDTGQSVIVIINDRGPYVRGRVIDLNEAAARRIGLNRDGIAPCKIEVLAYPLIETTGPRGNG